MATTLKANVIIPEILAEAIKAAFTGMKVLWGTQAAVINDSLPGDKRGGDTVKVPYFSALGEMDDVAENTALTPAALAMTSETAAVVHSGKAAEITEWAQLAAAFADPYAEIGRQFKELLVRRADKELITKAETSTLSVTKATTIDYDAVIDAKMQWGDEQADIALMLVHSKVLGDMYKLKDSAGRPLLVESANAGELARFAGIPVGVSDRISLAAGNYTNLIVKKGALAFWFNKTPTVQNDTDILRDTQILAMHAYFVAHLYTKMPGTTKPGVVKLITK